eukprot:1315847-Amorphochlora_amoeboformis.AAC.1
MLGYCAEPRGAGQRDPPPAAEDGERSKLFGAGKATKYLNPKVSFLSFGILSKLTAPLVDAFNADMLPFSKAFIWVTFLCLSTPVLGHRFFERAASFPVFLNTDVALETVAEIVTVTPDLSTLVYSDGKTKKVGFVSISDPENPQPYGTVAVAGEPTSVVAVGSYVLCAVNTSPNFINPSGALQVIDITRRTIVRTIQLNGQPDSISSSPDGKYVLVAIENERDEDLGDGRPPQLPAGFLWVVKLDGMPSSWTLTRVDLTGLPGMKFPTDPEPEFVAINANNEGVVTLQENNHLAIVNLETASVTASFAAGSVNLTDIDTKEEGAYVLTSGRRVGVIFCI